MLKAASIVDVDAFIEQANRIVGKYKGNPNLSTEAKQKAQALFRQFEEYLEAKGLKAC